MTTKRENWPPYRTPILFFCIGFGKGQVPINQHIVLYLWILWQTLVSLMLKDKMGHLLIPPKDN